MTIAKKIEVLKASCDNTWNLYQMAKNEGKTERAEKLKIEFCTMSEAINILTDNKLAAEIANVYGIQH